MPRVLARHMEDGTTIVIPNAVCIGLALPKPEEGQTPPITLVPLDATYGNVGWFSDVLALMGFALGPAGFIRADTGISIPSTPGMVFTMQLGYEGCLPVSALRFTVLSDGSVNGISITYPSINDGTRGSVLQVSS